MPEVPYFPPEFARAEGLRCFDVTTIPEDVPTALRAKMEAFPNMFASPGIAVPLRGEDGDGNEVAGTAWIDLETGSGDLTAPLDGAIILTDAGDLEAPGDVYLCARLADALAVRAGGGRALYANDFGRIKFRRMVRERRPGADRLIIVPGIDPARRDGPDGHGFDELREALTAMGAVAVVLWREYPFEALKRGLADGVADYLEAVLEDTDPEPAPEYRWPSLAEGLEGFLEAVLTRRSPALKTGLPALDGILDGGIRPGLYVLGAPSSLGKTTLALQIADGVARARTLDAEPHVLYFSCEQSADELRAKSLARTMAEDPDAIPLTASDILYRASGLDVAKKGELEDVARAHAERSRRFWVIDNDDLRESEDPRIGLDTILGHVDRLRAVIGPVPPLAVFIDYLQILYFEPQPFGRAPDRRLEIDDTLTVLRRMTRDSNTSVFLISSKNRDSVGKDTDLGGMKESSGIEYSADVLMELAPDAKEVGRRWNLKDKNGDLREPGAFEALRYARRMDDRPMILDVKKNRMGQVGTVALEYHARYDYVEERARRSDRAIPLGRTV